VPAPIRPLLVSIIVNNYNYDRYLAAAIDSALRQTYSAVEVIVVDDGSTDDSHTVIQKYGASITPLYQRNMGQAAAFNQGFARSRGDIVIFLDADDVLVPEMAAKAVEAFQGQPDAAKVMVRMAVIDDQGNPTGVLKPAAHLPLVDGDLRRQAALFPSDMTWMPTSGNAFSAPVLRQIMPVPGEYGRIGADWYVAQVTPLFGRVIFLDWVGAQYRVHCQNNYEQRSCRINVNQLRQTLYYADCTNRYIKHYAAELGLVSTGRQYQDLSVASLANRLISFKLAPADHPYHGDSTRQLLWLGAKAALRRFDVSWPMRLLFGAWFVAMASTPGRWARPLAEIFVYPEKRRALNHLLAGLHRS
jgi:glycosyltransferase involved in cell wall biosynthesis